MSRKGNCLNNAVTKNFFAKRKNELVHQCNFRNQQQARANIFEYIESFYNRVHRHSALDRLSPQQYEETA